VGELVLWCGMFAPKGRLEWYHGLARGAPLQKGRTFETIHECPLEIYPLFKGRLKENMTSGVEGDNRCRKRRRDWGYVYRQISDQKG
jgi:hypothetical protein